MMTMLACLMLTVVGSSIVRDQNADKAAKDMMAMEERIMNKLDMIMDKIDDVSKNKVADTVADSFAEAVAGKTTGGAPGCANGNMCCKVKNQLKYCCLAKCDDDASVMEAPEQCSPTGDQNCCSDKTSTNCNAGSPPLGGRP